MIIVVAALEFESQADRDHAVDITRDVQLATRVEEAESHLLDTKSSFADIREVVDNQTHLTDKQREELYQVLDQHRKLFDGTLGILYTIPPRHNRNIITLLADSSGTKWNGFDVRFHHDLLSEQVLWNQVNGWIGRIHCSPH